MTFFLKNCSSNEKKKAYNNLKVDFICVFVRKKWMMFPTIIWMCFINGQWPKILCRLNVKLRLWL